MNNKLPGTIATSQSDFETFTHQKTNMKTMRERFDEYFEYMSGGYYASRIGRHAVHPDDIKHFIEQEIKKEREEIVEIVSKEFDRQLESCTKFGHEPILYLPDTKRIIVNTIKNRYE